MLKSITFAVTGVQEIAREARIGSMDGIYGEQARAESGIVAGNIACG
jgi:hypothetical protein